MRQLLNKLTRGLAAVFGSWDIQWQRPGWASATWTWMLGHQRLLAGVFWLLVLSGTFWAWQSTRPVVIPPNLLTLTLNDPGIAKVQKDEEGVDVLVPDGLRIIFSESAAPLEMTGEDAPELTEGIEISPSVAGTWRWSSDRTLRFTPESDWLPDRTYEVRIQPKKLIVDTVILENTKPVFSTPTFGAKVTRSQFYQNPKDPTIKQVVVSLELTHGVTEEALREKIRIETLGDADLFAVPERLEEIRFENFNRKAHVRSRPIILPAKEDFVKVTIGKGVPVETGSSKTLQDLEAKIKVPSVFDHFKVSSANVTTRRTEKGEPEPVLTVGTSGLAGPGDLNANLKVHLLPPFEEPKNWPENQRKPTSWTIDTVTEEVLARSEVVKLKPDDPVDASKPEAERQKHFSRFTYGFGRFDETRQLHISLAKNTPGFGGYRLKDQFRVLRDIPEAPKELHVLGRFGGIMALTGDRKLTIKSRNLPALKFRIGRVPAAQVNHLVSQTGGNFRTPYFRNYRFNEDNFAHFAEETQPVFLKNSYEANYNTLDLAPHLSAEDPDDTDPNRGLFFVRIYGWDTKEDEQIKAGGDESDQAFILVTDLGIITKLNEDKSRDVFVQSIGQAGAVAGAEVHVLGKNGVAVQSVTTGPEGRARLNAFDDSARKERTPIAILVRNGADLSFMPLNNYQHHVSFSRFDIGGVTAPTPGDLDGFVFTERGIYRPGEKIHAAFIIKPRDWQGQLSGVPIKVRVQDARNTTVMEQVISLPESGFAEFECPTEYASPTGEYKLWVYLVHKELKNGRRVRDTLLASTTARVEEFLPDTMKVKTNVSPESGKGWVPPENLSAAVDVQNLYGTPAAERKVSGSVTAAPMRFSFDEYPDFVFFDRNIEHARYHNWSAGDTNTDENGKASFALDMKAIANATYSLRFEAQAFEPDSGRSVKGFSNRVLVSPLAYAVGYKPEGELNYVPAGTEKLVRLVAVNPKLERISVENVAYEVRETYFVSILKEHGSGNYSYQSVKKLRVTDSGTIALSAGSPLGFKLPTAAPGEFSVRLSNAEDQILSEFGYSVVGKGNRSRSLDDNAELFVKLAKPEWRHGEEIEMSITAPFTGSGLITIERDEVYAHTFFTTNTNSSVQKIRVPDGLEGTAYVNVTFTRALDSPEIFMSPLSYAVKPFRIANDRRKLTVELNPAKEARPGKPLRIPYKADRACKIAIYAVDEGILQVTRYQLPKPLPHFQRKRALLVNTYQILDLLIPEQRHIREMLPAFGGGADFNLNPFKRITEGPVVYWSGIIDAGPEEREVVYNVPDYFDGSLKVMAVAVSRDGMGQIEGQTTVVSPILLKPGVLTFAAPGDTFDVTVTVGNNLSPEAGEEAQIALEVTPSENLEIVQPPQVNHTIGRGEETAVTFKARAKEPLGNATFSFSGKSGAEESVRRSTLSVRPPVPYTTMVESGYSTEETVDVPVERPLYEEFRTSQAAASVLPLSLAHGLNEYLAKYPHGCTEQLVSGAFSRLLLSDEVDFGLTKAEIQKQIDATCRMLRSRMNSKGGFGMWYSTNHTPVDFLSIYATHFLTESKKSGFNVPPALLKSALDCLQTMAGLTNMDGDGINYRDQAYAIYVLTLNDLVTTNYILNLRDNLNFKATDPASEHRSWGPKRDLISKTWQGDTTAVHLAGSYQLLKQDAEGAKLIKGYRRALKREHRHPDDDFHRALAQDAQYLMVLANHFPDEAKKLTGEDLQALLEPVVKNQFSTLGAAYSVMALKGYSRLLDEFPIELNLSEVTGEVSLALEAAGKKLKEAEFSLEADLVRFSAKPTKDGPSGVFFQVTEGGFETELPTEVIREGLEITREYLDAEGNPVTEAKMGEPLTVQLKFRSLKRQTVIRNLALVDLLPGGFEVVRESLPAGRSRLPGIDFNEVREDRVVLFGSAPTQIRTLKYQVTPTRRGEFVVPPVLAYSMYDRTVRARGLPGTMVVE